MMCPRLYLARNLLRPDGAIFVSIDDRELDNLRKVCDEIFGEENFVGRIVWKNATDNNPTNVAIEHEYLVVYAKSKDCLESVWKSSVSDIKTSIVQKSEELLKQYSLDEELQAVYAEWFKNNKDQLWPLDGYKHIDRKGVYAGIRGVHNPGKEGYRYDVIHPETGKPCAEPLMGYRFPQSTLDKLIQEGKIIFGEDHSKIIELKFYAEDYQEKLSSVVELDGRSGAYDLRKLFPEHKKLFDNPKPVKFLCSFFPLVLKDSPDIVLDFFAGSASTAHAVFELNSKDCRNREFILVQLPEPTGRTDYPTIADITKERVRRVIKKLNAEDAAKQPSLLEDANPKQDRGFRVFKLAESNFKPWNADVPHDAETLQAQLFDHVNHIRSGRTQDDILYELLLKSGFPLTTPVDKHTMEGKTVFSVADGALLICLERALTMELVRAMAATKPERVVCLDEGFAGNDQLKTNAVQIFKTKGVTKFQTV